MSDQDHIDRGDPAPSSPAGQAQKPILLIVDDHEAMARGLSALFESAGYRPVVFHAGLRALDYARAAAREGSADARPALAVIDIHLPDISGLVLSQGLREAMGPSVPLIVLSGDGSMEVLNSLAHVGATYFFQKPVGTTYLLERVKELLARKG